MVERSADRRSLDIERNGPEALATLVLDAWFQPSQLHH